MRILRVIHTLDRASGGPAENAIASSLELNLRGHCVEIACLDHARNHVPLELTVHCFGAWNSYGYSPKFAKWVKENANNYDAVIIHGLWKFIGLGTWLAFKKKKFPYFVFPHGMLDPWFKNQYPLKHFKKSIYWKLFEEKILCDACAVLFTSQEEKELAQNTFTKARAARNYHAEVINYGSSRPPENSQELRENFLVSYPHLRNKDVILFLGRLHPKKGIDLLIQAFAAVKESNKDLHLLIAGPHDRNYLHELKILAHKLKIESEITWVGLIEGDMKWGAYFTAKVFCLPSHQENFGIAISEALSCGLPVLISNKVNIFREILHDKAGFVEEDTAKGVEELLTKWLKTSPKDRLNLSEAARKSFENRFNIQASCTCLIATIEKNL